MTRKEEIEKAANESVTESILSVAPDSRFIPRATDLLECAFIKGAEWADKTLIARAYEWLYDIYGQFDITDENGYRIDIRIFVDEFKKAMEE